MKLKSLISFLKLFVDDILFFKLEKEGGPAFTKFYVIVIFSTFILPIINNNSYFILVIGLNLKVFDFNF